MKGKESFEKHWKNQREDGRCRYVVKNALKIASYGLLGMILGSIFLYDSPSNYSLEFYLPKYFILVIILLLVGLTLYMFKWSRNEERYRKSTK